MILEDLSFIPDQGNSLEETKRHPGQVPLGPFVQKKREKRSFGHGLGPWPVSRQNPDACLDVFAKISMLRPKPYHWTIFAQLFTFSKENPKKFRFPLIWAKNWILVKISENFRNFIFSFFEMTLLGMFFAVNPLLLLVLPKNHVYFVF